MKEHRITIHYKEQPQDFLNKYLELTKPADIVQDMERIILNSCMTYESCQAQVPQLKPEMFSGKNRRLFISIKDLYEQKTSINVITVAVNLKKHGLKPDDVDLYDCYSQRYTISNPHNLEYYFKIFRFVYIQSLFRDLVSMAHLVLGNTATLGNMTEVKPIITSLCEALDYTDTDATTNAVDDVFFPHWITDGTNTYKVLKSKYGPGGYTWINNKSIKEYKLLAKGYKIIDDKNAEH